VDMVGMEMEMEREMEVGKGRITPPKRVISAIIVAELPPERERGPSND
jgi:hypothetical protein